MHDIFAGLLNEALADGVIVETTIAHHVLDGEPPQVRLHRVLSILATEVGYECRLQGYGVCELPKGTRFVMNVLGGGTK